MKYYKHEIDCENYELGFIFQEIDWEKDLIVRQITACGDKYRWGEWTGNSLVGFICDQKPSGFHPPLSQDEEIPQTEFEAVWNREGPRAAPR